MASPVVRVAENLWVTSRMLFAARCEREGEPGCFTGLGGAGWLEKAEIWQK
jgi:hypothetical protein